MKIGLLCCFYDCADKLYKIILPWLNIKEVYNYDLKIAVSHGMFKEYHDFGYQDQDPETLNLLKNGNWHDFLCIQEGKYEQEAIIRNYSLQYLLKQDIDVIILLDSDEIYNELQILNALKFIENNDFISWFSIEFKNLTFSENQYIKGFAPPRIFRVNINNLKLSSIYWDNDMEYLDSSNNKISYKNLSNLKIPTNLINPLHFTWLNDERSKKKIKYQEEHFKNGAGCSFKWDDKLGLQWNDNYFKKTGLFKPEIYNI